MSAGVVFQEALRILNRQPLPEVSRCDLAAALEAGQPGPLAFLYDAGAEANLPRQTLLTRAAAIYLGYCTINLCDDLTDNECLYLVEPFRSGPCTQFMLHNLLFAVLAEANLPGALFSAVARDLVAAGGAQHIEMRTRVWSAPVFHEVAEGIAGRQWSAYLQILWYGTPLASRAATIGMNLGLATLMWEDIRSSDPRYSTLPEADKYEILTWATAIAEALRKENLRCLDAALRAIDPVLTQEREKIVGALLPHDSLGHQSLSSFCGTIS
jgi:hypothetical protein